jgi:hypothetical protein
LRWEEFPEDLQKSPGCLFGCHSRRWMPLEACELPWATLGTQRCSGHGHAALLPQHLLLGPSRAGRPWSLVCGAGSELCHIAPEAFGGDAPGGADADLYLSHRVHEGAKSQQASFGNLCSEPLRHGLDEYGRPPTPRVASRTNGRGKASRTRARREVGSQVAVAGRLVTLAPSG